MDSPVFTDPSWGRGRVTGVAINGITHSYALVTNSRNTRKLTLILVVDKA